MLGCVDHLWQYIGIQAAIARLLRSRRYALPVERALFALVANRALAPMSKLGYKRWVAEEVIIPGLPRVPVHHLYRAMDFLLEAEEEVQREVFFATSSFWRWRRPSGRSSTHWTYALFTIGGRSASGPMSCCAGWPCCWCGSSSFARGSSGRGSVRSSSECIWEPLWVHLDRSSSGRRSQQTSTVSSPRCGSPNMSSNERRKRRQRPETPRAPKA